MKHSEIEALRKLNKVALRGKLIELKKQQLGLETTFRPGYRRLQYSDKARPPIFRKLRRMIAVIETIMNENRGLH